MSVLNFLQYHNAVPIALSIALLGAGGVFAATNPEAIYSAQQDILSIDNTYLANKDLSTYTPVVQIGVVTEDEEFYYVAYTFSTIDLTDYVWRDVTKNEVMKVSKADLGPYRDLGLYVTGQLKQLIDRELGRLRETQEIERRNVSQKVVATAYSGLIGILLNDKTEEIPGYTPVVVAPKPPPPPPPPPPPAPEPTPEPTPSPEPTPAPEPTPEPTPTPEPSPSPSPSPTPEGPAPDTTAPVLQVLGDNPANIAVGESYTDLGAAVTDDSNEELDVLIFVNGESVPSISIDTSTAGEWTVRYESTDSAGNSGEATRTVIVSEPAPEPTPQPVPSPEPTPAPPPSSETTDGQSEPTPAPEPSPTPEPTPEPPPAPAPEPSPEPTPEPPPPAPEPPPTPPPAE